MVKKLVGVSLIVAIAVSFISFVVCSECVATDQIVLKSGHITSTLSIRHKGAVKFAELVEQRSNGRVKIDVYPAQQLGDARSQFQALSMGTQDICFEGIAWWSQFDKDFNYYSVPFVFNSYEEIFKAYESDVGKEMFERIRNNVGIRCLAYNFEDCLRSLYSVKKPIKVPEDLNGVNMRVPGVKIYIEAWKELGANTVRVSWGELYTALMQGMVEASEGPLVEAYNNKFLEIEKYITMLNYKPSPLAVSISEKTWKKLPNDIQNILVSAAIDSGNYFTELMEKEEKQIENTLRNEGNVFVEFDRQSFIDKASNLPEKLEAEGMWSKGLHRRMMRAIGR